MRRWIGMLMVVALVLRGLVPAGFMPAFSAEGGVTVVICTDMGVEHVVIGDGESDRPSPNAAGDDCPYCAANMAAALSQPSCTGASSFALTAIEHYPFSAGQRPPVRAGPANGSRAPPAHA